MKLTLWRQFSSNHSSHFNVIGEFATIEQANEAVNELRNILHKIADYHLENDLPWLGDITPLEIELSQQYDVEWTMGVDWIGTGGESDEKEISDAVGVFDRFVSIKAGVFTWNEKQPYEGLLQRLGAQVAGWDPSSLANKTASWLTITCTCLAPDEAIAEKIHENWRENPPGNNISIQRDGRKLILPDMMIYSVKELPELIHSLQEQGCTDFQYNAKKIVF